jgi:hypothetical protein
MISGTESNYNSTTAARIAPWLLLDCSLIAQSGTTIRTLNSEMENESKDDGSVLSDAASEDTADNWP